MRSFPTAFRNDVVQPAPSLSPRGPPGTEKPISPCRLPIHPTRPHRHRALPIPHLIPLPIPPTRNGIAAKCLHLRPHLRLLAEEILPIDSRPHIMEGSCTRSASPPPPSPQVNVDASRRGLPPDGINFAHPTAPNIASGARGSAGCLCLHCDGSIACLVKVGKINSADRQAVRS